MLRLHVAMHHAMRPQTEDARSSAPLRVGVLCVRAIALLLCVGAAVMPLTRMPACAVHALTAHLCGLVPTDAVLMVFPDAVVEGVGADEYPITVTVRHASGEVLWSGDQRWVCALLIPCDGCGGNGTSTVQPGAQFG